MAKISIPTLLLISDNSSVRHSIRKHLDDEFFILEAKTEAKALDDIATSTLDFILLDADFENALLLCKRIRKTLHLTPLFLITGRLKKSFREEALKVGVTEFLSPECDSEELKLRIAEGKKAQKIRDTTSSLSNKIRPPKL